MVKFNHEPVTEEVDKISPGGAFSQFYQEIKSNFTEKVKSLPLDEEGVSTTTETIPEPSSEATSTVIQKPAGPTVLIATTSAEKAAN